MVGLPDLGDFDCLTLALTKLEPSASLFMDSFNTSLPLLQAPYGAAIKKDIQSSVRLPADIKFVS